MSFQIALCLTSVTNRHVWRVLLRPNRRRSSSPRIIPRCTAFEAGFGRKRRIGWAVSNPSPFAFNWTLRRNRPNLRKLHTIVSDASSAMPTVGWQELSVPSPTQIFGYIPVLHFCPRHTEIDSNRSLSGEGACG